MGVTVRNLLALFMLISSICGMQGATAEVRPAQSLGYLDYCPTQQLDRHRLCPYFFNNAFEPANRPDAVIFFRSRLNDLIRNTEDNLEASYRAHWFLSILIFGLAAWAALWALFRTQGALTVRGALALAALLISFGASFNYLNQFKTEFAAYRALATLRDEIDVELVLSARTGSKITADQLHAWLATYKTILTTHSAAYGETFKLPGLDIFGLLKG